MTTYKPEAFWSSTVMKKFNVPRRHEATWGTTDPARHTRGFIFHTERYQWDDMGRSPDSAESVDSSQGGMQFMVGSYADPALMVQLRGRGLLDQPNVDSLSQRERLQTELALLERMRGLRRRGQLVQHREPQHLLLGGKQVNMCERMDIMGEIARLRTMSHCLPTKAKDLYVGRGFKLPPSHKLNRGIPRGKSVGQTKVKKKPMSPDSVGLPLPGDMKKDLEWGKPHSEADYTELKVDEPFHRLSRLSTPGSPAAKGSTPNPLKGKSLIKLANDDEIENMREAFQQLNFSEDGRIPFTELQQQFSGLSSPQQQYMEQVYDITSTSTMIGHEEFVSLSVLAQKISNLNDEVKVAFDNVDIAALPEAIVQYVEFFQSVDRTHTGRLSVAALHQILSATLQLEDDDDAISSIISTVLPNGGDDVDKLTFVAYIPYFVSREPQLH